MDKKILGTCPLCGGNVVKTSRGFKCENNSGQNGGCSFFINIYVGNRQMSDEDISRLLADKESIFDGFVSKEQKTFSSVLKISESGQIEMNNIVAKCPHCGGDIKVNSRAFGCSNFHRQDSPCTFTVWRNIYGHDVSLTEIRELCENGIISHEVELYNQEGIITSKKLTLSQDKLKAVVL